MPPSPPHPSLEDPPQPRILPDGFSDFSSARNLPASAPSSSGQQCFPAALSTSSRCHPFAPAAPPRARGATASPLCSPPTHPAPLAHCILLTRHPPPGHNPPCNLLGHPILQGSTSASTYPQQQLHGAYAVVATAVHCMPALCQGLHPLWLLSSHYRSSEPHSASEKPEAPGGAAARKSGRDFPRPSGSKDRSPCTTPAVLK